MFGPKTDRDMEILDQMNMEREIGTKVEDSPTFCQIFDKEKGVCMKCEPGYSTWTGTICHKVDFEKY